MARKTLDLTASISGHVWLYRASVGRHGARDGGTIRASTRSVSAKLGRAGVDHHRGFLRRRNAEALLEEILVDARRGQLRQQRTGVTFANVAEDWYTRGPLARDWSPSTQRDYRSVLDTHLLPEFGTKRIETITPEQLEQWRDRLARDGERSRKTVNKIATQAHAIFQHAVERLASVSTSHRKSDGYAKATTPGASISSLRRRSSCSPPLPRGARTAIPTGRLSATASGYLRTEEDRKDGVIYLTAALAGLRRSELLALLWEDVDFGHSSIRVYEGYAARKTGRPKSRKSRTVPMIDQLGAALTDLKGRGHHTARRDHVFVSRLGTELDGSALRRRYIAARNAAGLRPLRFHDPRHTFASVAINVASITQVQAWMGHANVTTTMRHPPALHSVPPISATAVVATHRRRRRATCVVRVSNPTVNFAVCGCCRLFAASCGRLRLFLEDSG